MCLCGTDHLVREGERLVAHLHLPMFNSGIISLDFMQVYYNYMRIYFPYLASIYMDMDPTYESECIYPLIV